MAKQKLSDRARHEIDRVRRGEISSLDLSGEGLDDVPDEIFGLESLDELYLSANKLRVIPDRIRALNLKTLDVSGNPIEELPDVPGLKLNFGIYRRLAGSISPENIKGLAILPGMIGDSSDLIETFGSLRTLDSLYIQDMPLVEFPAGIRNLTSLRYLTLMSCGIRVVPEWITELRQLEYLNLRRNELREFPNGVFDLSSLRVLGLNEMPHIREIPGDILRLQNLERLRIDTSEMREPPPEIVDRGVEAIRNFWRQRLAAEVDYLCEAKLLILGESGAGKTSLARKIQNAAYKLHPDETSTEGIEVAAWSFPSVLHVKDQAISRDFRVNIWDFGGQEIYHATHQFF